MTSALPAHRRPGSPRSGLPARLAVVGVAAGVLLAGGVAVGWSAPAVPPGTGACDLTLPAGCTFTVAGGKVDVKVPAGVGRLVAFVTGGEGGSPGATNGGGGGGGGETIADFAVTTGQVLTAWPGTRAGAAAVGRGYADGGSRGKGYGARDGAAGGAASAVLTGGTPLVVAGGGGGGGGDNGTRGGDGGAGGLPAVDGQDGTGACYVGTRHVQVGFHGDGGKGGGARTRVGASGRTGYAGPGGGGGGGGYDRGGDGGRAGAGLCGGAGGGGGGKSFAGNGAHALSYSGVSGNGDGMITLRRYTGSMRFGCDRRTVPWNVPTGVRSVYAVAVGGEGGHPTHSTSASGPGHGARVTGTLDVTTQRSFDVTVGCTGNSGAGYGLGHGGSRGTASPAGSDNGGGGGGATAIRGGDRSALVAGGGGGAGGSTTTGAPGGGRYAGGAGGQAGYGPGASGTRGGARGEGDFGDGGGGGPGARQRHPEGGDGGTSSTGGGGGGGGGGCLRGGDGGSHGGLFGGGGGGGAGDSCNDAGLVTDVRYAPSTNPDDGFVLFVY
jgi:hypothetical protein